MSQIWEDQLRKSPKDYKLKESIGDLSISSGMTFMAIQQYQAASMLALGQAKYLHALKLAIKSENSLLNLTNSDLGESNLR